MSNNKDKKSAPPTIRRVTIDKKGSISEKQIPTNSVKKEAIDISQGSPTTLLLTREAAMRITEQAISEALASTWTHLLKTEKAKQAKGSKKPEEISPKKVDPKAILEKMNKREYRK